MIEHLTSTANRENSPHSLPRSRIASAHLFSRSPFPQPSPLLHGLPDALVVQVRPEGSRSRYRRTWPWAGPCIPRSAKTSPRKSTRAKTCPPKALWPYFARLGPTNANKPNSAMKKTRRSSPPPEKRCHEIHGPLGAHHRPRRGRNSSRRGNRRRQGPGLDRSAGCRRTRDRHQDRESQTQFIEPMHKFQVATYAHLIARRQRRRPRRHAGQNQNPAGHLSEFSTHHRRNESRPNALSRGARSHAATALHAQPIIDDVFPAKLFLLAALRTGMGRRGPGVMKPQRNPRYLAWIRTQPCCVCGVYSRDRSFAHRPARPGAEIPRLLRHPALR